MEYQSLKLPLNCIIRSDILFACLGVVISFWDLFPYYLIIEAIFFNILISNIWHLRCLEKCSSKFFHKFVLLRIFLLKDSKTLLLKWAYRVQKCKSTFHGITAPDALLKKKTEICKTKKLVTWPSFNRKYQLLRNLWQIMYFFYFLKF